MNQYLSIIARHLETKSISGKNYFLTKAIRSLLSALPDPYSSFSSPEQLRKEQQHEKGDTFKGFGIELRKQHGKVFIADLLSHSPSIKSGLLPGDHVLSIQGKKITGLRKAWRLLTPRGHHEIPIVISRNGTQKKFFLIPGKIHLIPFEAKQIDLSSHEKIGYIRMTLIVPGDGRKFLKTARKFEINRDNLLVLNLTGAVGGDLKTAEKIADLFLPSKSLLFTEKSRSSSFSEYSKTEPRITLPLVIVVNGGTASAAELLTAALKDHHAAYLYGSRTLGKGYIQSSWHFPVCSSNNKGFPFLAESASEFSWDCPNNWVLQFTTAEFIRPSGKRIEGTGIAPNVLCRGVSYFTSCSEGKFTPVLERLFQNHVVH
jgi:carboxyl-terminal processing protease